MHIVRLAVFDGDKIPGPLSEELAGLIAEIFWFSGRGFFGGGFLGRIGFFGRGNLLERRVF